MRRAARWLFYVAPCRLYVAGEARGGAVPFGFMLGAFGVGLLSGAVTALGALAFGGDVADGFANGLIAGLAAVAVWAVYALALLCVLWVLGGSPVDVALGEDASLARAKHAAVGDESGWRRRGLDPLVPGGLVAFFGLMTVVGVGDAAWTASKERDWAGPLIVVPAEVVSYDDGRFRLGDRRLVVRYDASTGPSRGKVDAEDVDGDIPPPGGTVSVEYLANDAARVRPAGTRQQKESDIAFSKGLAATSAALMAASGGWFLLERRRRST